MYFWENDLIEIRMVNREDAEFLEKILSDTKGRLQAEHGVALPASRQEAEDMAEYAIECQENKEELWFCILNKRGTKVGYSVVDWMDEKTGSVQFSITIGKEYRKRGYGTAASKKILEYLFWENRYHKVGCTVLDTNDDGNRFIRKLGFTEDAYRTEMFFYHGQYHGEIYYSMLRDEYDFVNDMVDGYESEKHVSGEFANDTKIKNQSSYRRNKDDLDELVGEDRYEKNSIDTEWHEVAYENENVSQAIYKGSSGSEGRASHESCSGNEGRTSYESCSCNEEQESASYESATKYESHERYAGKDSSRVGLLEDRLYFWEYDGIYLTEMTEEYYMKNKEILYDTEDCVFYDSDVRLPKWEEELTEFEEKHLNFGIEDNRIEFAICDMDDKYLGNINICGLDRKNGKFSFSIYIRRKARGKGYASKALRLIMLYCFEELRMHKMISCVTSGNNSSANLMLSVGCKCEGVLRDNEYFHGKYRDTILFGVNRMEFLDTLK